MLGVKFLQAIIDNITDEKFVIESIQTREHSEVYKCSLLNGTVYFIKLGQSVSVEAKLYPLLNKWFSEYTPVFKQAPGEIKELAIVLEDVGCLPIVERDYPSVLQIIARLHKTFQDEKCFPFLATTREVVQEKYRHNQVVLSKAANSFLALHSNLLTVEFRNFLSLVKDKLGELNTTCWTLCSPCLIHSDLREENIRKKNGTLKLIDWEFCEFGCWALDVSQFIGLIYKKCQIYSEQDLVNIYLEERFGDLNQNEKDKHWNLYYMVKTFHLTQYILFSYEYRDLSETKTFLSKIEDVIVASLPQFFRVSSQYGIFKSSPCVPIE